MKYDPRYAKSFTQVVKDMFNFWDSKHYYSYKIDKEEQIHNAIDGNVDYLVFQTLEDSHCWNEFDLHPGRFINTPVMGRIVLKYNRDYSSKYEYYTMKIFIGDYSRGYYTEKSGGDYSLYHAYSPESELTTQNELGNKFEAEIKARNKFIRKLEYFETSYDSYDKLFQSMMKVNNPYTNTSINNIGYENIYKIRKYRKEFLDRPTNWDFFNNLIDVVNLIKIGKSSQFGTLTVGRLSKDRFDITIKSINYFKFAFVLPLDYLDRVNMNVNMIESLIKSNGGLDRLNGEILRARLSE